MTTTALKTDIRKKKECIERTAGIATITDDDIKSDERLAYILRNNR